MVINKECGMALALYEMLERMTCCGISANLVLYLTKNLNQGTVTASNNVTYWGAAIWLTPILGAYVADAHLGRYFTFLAHCLCFLFHGTPPPIHPLIHFILHSSSTQNKTIFLNTTTYLFMYKK